MEPLKDELVIDKFIDHKINLSRLSRYAKSGELLMEFVGTDLTSEMIHGNPKNTFREAWFCLITNQRNFQYRTT